MECQHPGELLRSWRERQGVSQRALAIRAATSQDAISRIERGAERPTLERFEQLMLALGLRMTYGVEPLASPVEGEELDVGSSMTPTERLSEAASWNRVASELAAAGRRARREGHPATRIGGE